MSPLRLAFAVLALSMLGACATASPGAPAPPPANLLLPPVSLPRYPDSVPVNLDDERGKVLVLDFWATWCEPCRAALPEWEALAEAYRDRDVRLYAVSVDEDLKKVDEFIRAVNLNVPVLLDRDAAVAEGLLRLQVVPTAFIVDKKGAIRAVHQGYAPGEVKGFAKEIDPLLAEQ